MKELYQVWSPAMQWGFGGFALILICVVVWLFNKVLNKVLGVISKNSEVVNNNTAAIESLKTVNNETKEAVAVVLKRVEDVRDRILSRPCLREESPTPIPSPRKGPDDPRRHP